MGDRHPGAQRSSLGQHFGHAHRSRHSDVQPSRRHYVLKPGFLRVLQDVAAEQGFDAVGTTPARPVPTFDKYVEWIEAGHHGEMAYMARDPQRRADPAELAPGTHSLVVLATNYRTAVTGEDLPALHGRIAKYAYHQDYHDVLAPKLEAVARVLKAEVGGNTRNYTDTGAVLERDAGVRAGIGFAAKNSMLIRPGLGSHFFLSEILATAKLPETEPVSPGCGTCQICIDECPTNAIVEPLVVDARLCISYLTIELRGPIPIALRSQIGRWVFGCDICQDCCPWNAHERTTSDPAFVGRGSTDLTEVLALTPETFKARYRGSPIYRTKRAGLLRNACVALGNEANPAALGALGAALRDAEALVRSHAAWALGCFEGHKAARNALEAAIAGETEAWVIAEIRDALARLS